VFPKTQTKTGSITSSSGRTCLSSAWKDEECGKLEREKYKEAEKHAFFERLAREKHLKATDCYNYVHPKWQEYLRSHREEVIPASAYQVFFKDILEHPILGAIFDKKLGFKEGRVSSLLKPLLRTLNKKLYFPTTKEICWQPELAEKYHIDLGNATLKQTPYGLYAFVPLGKNREGGESK
jgi:hypothetical protein